MDSRWLTSSPRRALTACAAVAGLVGLASATLGGSLVLTLVTPLLVFSVASLLVADTPEFRVWKPRGLPGRALKWYVEAYESLRYGRAQTTATRVLYVILFVLLAATVGALVLSSTL